jgi:hypothetical protein
LFVLEEISEGQVYDPRDIQRFNEVDGYALMFIQHGQYGKTFDEKKALRIFHDAMIWRKQNNTYGKFTKDQCLFFKLINFRYFTRTIPSRIHRTTCNLF